ncbi:MAG: DUF58 domain-containing protein [Lachnospiraceae bacterium]|nr:DUF58 domain-containing protein [Lachnospiraceae bacterium]
MSQLAEKRIRPSILGWIRFGLLFGVVFLSWWFLRSYLLFMALILMVGCAAVSCYSLMSSRDLITAETVIPQGKVGKKADFPFLIRVRNPRRFWGFSADLAYSWGNVFTDYFQEKKERIWLAPMRGCEIRQALDSRYAGRIETRILAFAVYDLFHLFCLTGCAVKDSGVVAYPTQIPAPDDEIYSCVDGFPREDESKQRGTEYNPDYEIREYIPGDELKNIHWKLTAKQNKLMVRERLKSGKQKVSLVLPLTDAKQENDELMDALAYLGQLFLEKEYPVQLYWTGAGNDLQSRYIAEQGELEAAIGQILSGNGKRQPGSTRAQMEMEHPGESYVLVQAGAYKGAYIR